MKSIIALMLFAAGLYLGSLIGYKTAIAEEQWPAIQMEIENGRIK